MFVVFRPPSHHLTTSILIIDAVVGTAYLVFIRVRQPYFENMGLKAHSR